MEGAFTDAHGRPVRITATNAAPAEGGTDRQTVSPQRVYGPLRGRSRARTSRSTRGECPASRARALMLTSNEDTSIAENTGVLCVVPVGGGTPTVALRNVVLKQVTEVYPCTLTR